MANNKRCFHSLSRQIALKLGLLHEYNFMYLTEEKKFFFFQYSSMYIFLLKCWVKVNALYTCSPFLHASLIPIPTLVNNTLFTIHPFPTSQQFWEVLLFPCTILPRHIERICSLQWEMASRSHWTSGVEKRKAFSYWWLPVRLNPHGLLSFRFKGSCCKQPSQQEKHWLFSWCSPVPWAQRCLQANKLCQGTLQSLCSCACAPPFQSQLHFVF